MRKRLFAIIAISWIIILSSCSFVDEKNTDTNPVIYPDLSLYDTTYKVGRDDGNPFIIKAKLIEIYNNDDKAIASNVSFFRYDINNEIELQGIADKVEINTITEDTTLSGNVEINLIKDGLKINSDSVNWDNAKSIMDTDEGLVSVVWNNTNIILGYGFSGNLNTRDFELSKIKEGLINEDK